MHGRGVIYGAKTHKGALVLAIYITRCHFCWQYFLAIGGPAWHLYIDEGTSGMSHGTMKLVNDGFDQLEKSEGE